MYIEKIKSCYKKYIGHDILKFTLFLFIIFTFLLFVQGISYLIKDGNLQNWGSLGNDPKDFLMDFLNLNQFAYVGDLSKNSNPALTLWFAKFFSLFADYSIPIGSDALQIVGIAISVLLYLSLPVFVLLFALKRVLAKRYSKKIILLFFCFSCFTAPMFFEIDRGNYIIWSFAFTILFLLSYNSKYRYKKELSYLFLSVAGAMKFYPLIFGVIILRKKDWIGFVKTVLYVALLIVLPFLAFPGGINNFVPTYQNIFDYSANNLFGNITGSIGFDISINSLIATLFWFANKQSFVSIIQNDLFLRITLIINVLVLLLLIFAALLCKKKWQITLACSLAVSLVPHPSFIYTTIFLYIPLVYFITENSYMDIFKKKSLLLVFYICLIETMFPLHLGNILQRMQYDLMPALSVKQIITTFCLLILVLLLVLVSFQYLHRDLRLYLKKRKINKQNVS